MISIYIYAFMNKNTCIYVYDIAIYKTEDTKTFMNMLTLYYNYNLVSS